MDEMDWLAERFESHRAHLRAVANQMLGSLTLTATFLTVKAFLPGMTARRSGSIITMASVAARLPGGAPIAYASAKAGIIVFSKQVAKEAGPSGVRVNCLAPSTVVTETMQAAIPLERQRQMAAMYPLGPAGRSRRRRSRRAVPGLGCLVVDHRDNARYRRWAGDGVKPGRL